MRNRYHILNGDALMEQFPNDLQGEILVMRDCLVDGPVEGDHLEELIQNRIRFLSEAYQISEQEYRETVVAGFTKIMNIRDADIYLWFEDDLFCQVNLWFLVNLINAQENGSPLFLVRPPVHTQYGFGGLSSTELKEVFNTAMKLEEEEKLSKLWEYYQNDDLNKLNEIALTLGKKYPFISIAVQAHIDRIPTENDPGRPVKALKEIKSQLNTNDFGPVFAEFCKRESIYGFGDLQVKKLFDQITE